MIDDSPSGGLFLGMISGTSMDGIDAALVDFSEKPLRVIAYSETPYPDELRSELQIAQQSEPVVSLRRIKQLDIRVGRCFSDAANQLLRTSGVAPSSVIAIGSHGQTILHSPNTEPPFSWQIGDPATIAFGTGINTIGDFRSLDVAAGGQGAPLVPGFHEHLWRTTAEDRVIANIGGIANVTVLPADPNQPVIAFDSGPGNCLLDWWISRHHPVTFDRDGGWAASGVADAGLLWRLRSDPYFVIRPPKSTGRDYFNAEWLLPRLAGTQMDPENVQSTLTDLTAHTIVEAAVSFATNPLILVCGGGANNAYLMRRLASVATGCRVEATSAFGLGHDRVEACAFAWLAKLRVEGRALNISVSGACQNLPLGALYLARESTV